MTVTPLPVTRLSSSARLPPDVSDPQPCHRDWPMELDQARAEMTLNRCYAALLIVAIGREDDICRHGGPPNAGNPVPLSVADSTFARL
jgi:hypothetical protein